MEHKGLILLFNEEPLAVRTLAGLLGDDGYRTFVSGSMRETVTFLQEEEIDALIADIGSARENGMETLQEIREYLEDIPVIMLTTSGSVETAVSAIMEGAFYYFIKPPDYIKLKGIIARAVEQRGLKKEVRSLRETKKTEPGLRIFGNDTHIRRITDTIESLSNTMCSVLIRGEMGTGKELVARVLHSCSEQGSGLFVPVNCAVSAELLEVELFGSKKRRHGLTHRPGKINEALRGTLFLDEIAEIQMPLQEKILKVFRQGSGSTGEKSGSFRVVSSTKRDIKREIQSGRFRQDLYSWISNVEIVLPPLRERKNDMELLASAFIREFGAREKKNLLISEHAMDIMQWYSWPGNIRQLRNVIERAVVLATGDIITAKELPSELLCENYRRLNRKPTKTLKEIGIQAVREAMHECNGNKSRAAKMLGISRKTFYHRLRDMGS